MYYSKPHIMKKTPDTMKKTPDIKTTNNRQHNEYSLQKHFFDPCSNSPKNDFMLKLELRKCLYDSNNKDDKRHME